MALIQNEVKNIPQLSILETLDEYTSKTSGNGSSTHLTYTSYYNLLINACIRYDTTNTSTPSKGRNVYATDSAQNYSMIAEPHKANSLQTLIHLQMIFIRYIRPNKANHHQNHYQDFKGINLGNHLPLHPRNPSKSMMVLFMSLLKCTNSSALKLLLHSRNTTLRP